MITPSLHLRGDFFRQEDGSIESIDPDKTFEISSL
jgi:hypothetical protein